MLTVLVMTGLAVVLAAVTPSLLASPPKPIRIEARRDRRYRG